MKQTRSDPFRESVSLRLQRPEGRIFVRPLGSSAPFPLVLGPGRIPRVIKIYERTGTKMPGPHRRVRPHSSVVLSNRLPKGY